MIIKQGKENEIQDRPVFPCFWALVKMSMIMVSFLSMQVTIRFRWMHKNLHQCFPCNHPWQNITIVLSSDLASPWYDLECYLDFFWKKNNDACLYYISDSETKNADMCKLSLHGSALWNPLSLWTSNTSTFPSMLPSVFSCVLIFYVNCLIFLNTIPQNEWRELKHRVDRCIEWTKAWQKKQNEKWETIQNS